MSPIRTCPGSRARLGRYRSGIRLGIALAIGAVALSVAGPTVQAQASPPARFAGAGVAAQGSPVSSEWVVSVSAARAVRVHHGLALVPGLEYSHAQTLGGSACVIDWRYAPCVSRPTVESVVSITLMLRADDSCAEGLCTFVEAGGIGSHSFEHPHPLERRDFIDPAVAAGLAWLHAGRGVSVAFRWRRLARWPRWSSSQVGVSLGCDW